MSKKRPKTGEVQVYSGNRTKVVLLIKIPLLYIISFKPHNNMQSDYLSPSL